MIDDQRVSDLQAEYAKHLESWDRTRERLTRERALLLWLHAEAVWSREQAIMDEALTWRKLVEQWEQGHQNEVLPYTASLEEEIARLRTQVADLDSRRARWAEEHEKRRDELAVERSSRQARAEEALRLQVAADTLIAEMAEEARWQRDVYQKDHDERAAARLIGLEDALRDVRQVFQPPVCPKCHGPADATWFDRTLCPEPCGSMHTRCYGCGVAVDGCVVDPAGGVPTAQRVCACPTDDQLAKLGAGFTRPQCTVHPEGGQA